VIPEAYDWCEKVLWQGVRRVKPFQYIEPKKLVKAYMGHLKDRADPLGLLHSEFNHMIEAMKTANAIMKAGPEYFSEHRDALLLATLFHDIAHITKRANARVGEVDSLENFLARNMGKKEGDKYNGVFVAEVAEAAIGQQDELYERVVAAVTYSGGRHKMPEADWEETQWVHPLRIADNMATQREMGNRHMALVYLWAVDVYQRNDTQENVAQRIQKRRGFCEALRRGEIKDVIQDQVLERKGIDLAGEFPELLDRVEELGGLGPVCGNSLTGYTTSLQCSYNGQLNKMFPAFARVGYRRTEYQLLA
jgi:hypothetical protein